MPAPADPPLHGLRFGPVPATAAHLCVDMQRLFAADSPWAMPWFPRVLPNVVRITEARPARTVFTRFVPAREPAAAAGTWRRYYQVWRTMTLREIGPEMVGLVDELARFVPPAVVFDKPVYSPWWNPRLRTHLVDNGVDTVVVTGGETDVCVLATVLGAVDLGFRVVIVTDALCSSSDDSHDAMTALYHRRFGQQVEAAATDEVLAAWEG